MKVLITGGSGLVGKTLAGRLLAREHSVAVLTRSPARAKLDPRVEAIGGDPGVEGPWLDRVAGCDAIVHLAGENLFAARWDDDFKRRIRDSRTVGTRNVARAIARAVKKPVLVSASAIGFYGPHGDELLDESSPPGSDFVAGVCRDWEAATALARDAGARVVIARIGVVLDPAGGALAQMLPPFKLYAGGPAGSGRQWVSWIHALDVADQLVFAVERSELSGPFNATAPEPVTMGELAKAIGRALGRPSWLPVPAFALRLALGEVSDMIVNGARILPRKLMDLGFTFAHPKVDGAVRDLLVAKAG